MVTGVLDWLGPVRDNTEHVDIGGRTWGFEYKSKGFRLYPLGNERDLRFAARE